MIEGNWTLVDKTGKPMKRAAYITDFRGDRFILLGGTPPHKPSSSGRVLVKFYDDDCPQQWEFFPSVFNLVWKDMTND